MIPYFRPDALHLFGPVSIQPFGVLLALGFLFGMFVCQIYARKRGIDPRTYSDLVVWLAAGALVFGHVGHMFYEPQTYIDNPIQIFKIWEGLSSMGGYLGCTVVAVWFFRARNISWMRGGDILMIGLFAGIVVARMGCFVVHDHVGRQVEDAPPILQSTLGWLALDFPDKAEVRAVGEKAIEEARAKKGDPVDAPIRPNEAFEKGLRELHMSAATVGQKRFDLGLMESLLALGVVLILGFLARKPRREGLLLGLAPLLYAPVRFLWDSLRNTDLSGQASDTRYAGLTPAQYGVFILIGLGLLTLYLSRSRPHWPTAEDGPWVEPVPEPKAPTA